MRNLRKSIAITIVAAMIASLGAAFAQSTQSHDVTITIPDVLLIEILGPVTPSVSFVFGETAYTIAVDRAPALAVPTAVSGFDAVRVFSNRASWVVNVSATPLTGPLALVGLELGDISVVPSATVDPILARDLTWRLTATPAAIASGAWTRGWRALGFSGWDYRLAVQGDEGAGTFTTTVTYTIITP